MSSSERPMDPLAFNAEIVSLYIESSFMEQRLTVCKSFQVTIFIEQVLLKYECERDEYCQQLLYKMEGSDFCEMDSKLE